MQALTQFLVRNIDHFAGERSLWINLPADAPLPALRVDEISNGVFCQDFREWRSLSQAGANATFGDFPDVPPRSLETVVMTLPREKARLNMMLVCVADLLSPSGTLWLAGETRAGIKSAPRHLATYFENIKKMDSARHCVLFRANDPLSQSFKVRDWASDWTLKYSNHDIIIRSWPGVFAHGSLDAGSQLLLESLPSLDPACRFLDFGCGAGVIATSLLCRQPELSATLIDTSALACRSARETIGINKLKAQVLASDGFSEVSDKFDLVVSNPPFHIGHKRLVAMSPALLGPIRNFLNPGGQFIMVANRHLPYRHWLNDTFGQHDVLASNHSFHVLACRNQ